MLTAAVRHFRYNAIEPAKHLKKLALISKSQQPCFSSTWQQRYYTTRTEQNDFRHIGTEKDAGALQDLLRRVMEIDAEITCTPVVDYKPNTQNCTAYWLTDTFNLNSISHRLSSTDEFGIMSSYKSMLHILDHHQGGDIYLFSNGTLVYWGMDQDRQQFFLNEYIKRHCAQEKEAPDFVAKVCESKVMAEYTIDEDEMTDMKGDVIILNPHIPSIEQSKIAFSYGIGRAAKLNIIEKAIDELSNQLSGTIPSLLSGTKDVLSSSSMLSRLLSIQQSVFLGAHDGLLGTNSLHWAKPELEEYVTKISKHYDVHTRIQILNKKIEYFHLSLKHF